jgi:hypothetical protein
LTYWRCYGWFISIAQERHCCKLQDKDESSSCTKKVWWG